LQYINKKRVVYNYKNQKKKNRNNELRLGRKFLWLSTLLIVYLMLTKKKPFKENTCNTVGAAD
jgi:hypothetical protein